MNRANLKPRISLENFLIGWKVSQCENFQAHTVRSGFLDSSGSRVLLYCWGLMQNSHNISPIPEITAFLVVASSRKHQFQLGLSMLCHFYALPQIFYLSHPHYTFPHLHKAFFLWFFLGIDLSRFDWIVSLIRYNSKVNSVYLEVHLWVSGR